MKRRLALLVVLCLCAAAITVADKVSKKDHRLISGIVANTGDTAQRMLFLPGELVDSFQYIDTFVISNGTSLDSTEVAWSTPGRKLRITPDTSVYGMDSIVWTDTFEFVADYDIAWTSAPYTLKSTPRASNTYQYVCSVVCVIDTFVATYTSDGTASVAEATSNLVDSINATTTLTDSVVAEDSTTYFIVRPSYGSGTMTSRIQLLTDTGQTPAVSFANTPEILVDSLVAIINATTDLKDSVLAQDSGAYAMCVQKVPILDPTVRWTTRFDLIGDGSVELFDTVGIVATAAMIADSLIAVINDVLALDLIAADSTTVGYTAQALDAGLGFVYIMGDTASNATTDTVTIWANFTHHGGTRDTFQVIKLLDVGSSYGQVMARIIVGTAADSGTAGLGLSDSATVQLLTIFGSEYHHMDSSGCGALPCTTRFIWPDSAGYYSGGDTLMKDYISIIVWAGDTTNDTTMSTYYDITTHVVAKER